MERRSLVTAVSLAALGTRVVAQIRADCVHMAWRPSPPVAHLYGARDHANGDGVINDSPCRVKPFAAELGNELPGRHPLDSRRVVARDSAACAARNVPGHENRGRLKPRITAVAGNVPTVHSSSIAAR